MTGRVAGKVAMVTGCGSVGPGWGNGKAISALLAREGARVFGCDINLSSADATREIVAAEVGHGCIEVAQCDVSSSQSVESTVAACVKRFGKIDILVNNVGIIETGGVVEFPLERWQRALDVNITSMFLTCKFVIPQMLQGGSGSIVNVGSIAGIRYTGVPYIAYSTTKAAVLGFSRSVALEFARHGIRSNVVMPGLLNTPLILEPLKDAYGPGGIQQMVEKRNAQCPTGSMGDAWDTAAMTLYLASDESNYVTAGEFVVDGGLTAKYA
jgi:NAD(P)-dependent dehydrogenase (short-subunit alcohol dehydrogenase family)